MNRGHTDSRRVASANRSAGPKNLFNIVQAPLLLQGHHGNAEENLNFSGEMLMSANSQIILSDTPEEPKATAVKK